MNNEQQQAEELFFCPLECGARIKDLQKHINRCRHKNDLMVKYLICYYNSFHIIKKEEFNHHLIICENSIILLIISVRNPRRR